MSHLVSNIDNIITDINSFLEKISNSEKVQKDSAPAPSSSTSAEETSGLPDTTAPFILKIHFDHGCGMENLRAFMIVSALQDSDLAFEFFPADVETNPATADSIVESGFFVALSSQNDVNTAISLLKEQPSIETYEVIEKKAEAASETTSGAKSEKSAHKDSSPKPASDTSAVSSGEASSYFASSAASGHANSNTKQSLISVNLSKLDSLMAIVGEIVITESMVTSSPEIQNLKLDSFEVYPAAPQAYG